jgi:type II secretory pathway pseudopilin PulG
MFTTTEGKRLGFETAGRSLRPARKQSGWTLPEMLIGMSLGTLILGSVISSYVGMQRSLDATMNYQELDRQSRNALDLITMDIRETVSLTSFATNRLTFTNQDGSVLSYDWDGTNILSYSNASTTLDGCPRGGVLLRGCNFLKFSVFQRNPSNGTTMTFWPAPITNPALAKVIIMDWTCRRTNYTTITDSESVQSAKVVMRN